MKTKILILSAAAFIMAASVVSCSKNTPGSDDPSVPTPDTPSADAPVVSASPDTVPSLVPDANPDPTSVSERGSFAKGADVSWVTELESQGEKFYNEAGREMELMELLRDYCGINSIRLRVWVDPVDGWCNIDDVLVKARRAHNLGLRLMIDFHFSDWWADPGKQTIPVAWNGLTLGQLKEALASHITDMLSRLKAFDIEPEWVQVGNETTTGMLWPLGSTTQGDNFTQLVNAGYDTVKAIFPDASVIIHCDKGEDAWRYNYLFGKLEAEGARYDMIGMSLYPEPSNWDKTVNDCLSNIDAVQKAYKKPVMICEIGFNYKEPIKAEQMLQKMLDGALKRDVKGIFWWEPETPESNGYDKGAFQNGRPTGALKPFLN